MRAFFLAFLAFGPSDIQLHLYGPYISICATCELGYSSAVWPKQLTVTAQEYFTKKKTLWAAKGCKKGGSGKWETGPSLLSSNFNDSRRCLLFFPSISIKLASASGWGSTNSLSFAWKLLACSLTLKLSSFWFSPSANFISINWITAWQNNV